MHSFLYYNSRELRYSEINNKIGSIDMIFKTMLDISLSILWRVSVKIPI